MNNSRILKILTFLLMFLIGTAGALSAEDNPATRIRVDAPGQIEIAPKGEVLIDVKLTIPLAYFVFVDLAGNSKNKVVTFSFPENSGLAVTKVNYPAGTKYRNDMTLNNTGTFQVFVKDQGGLRPGTVTNTTLYIHLQISSTKQVYPEYTLQKDIALKVSGPARPEKTDPPIQPHIPHDNPVKGIFWEDDYKQAVATAAKTRQFLFLYFTSTANCQICDWMEKNILNNPEVIELVNSGFIPVRVNQRQQNLIKDFNIKSFPTVVIADWGGRVSFSQMGRVPLASLTMNLRKYAHEVPVTNIPSSPIVNDVAGVLYDKNNRAVVFTKSGRFIEYDLSSGRYLGRAALPITDREWKGLAPYSKLIVGALNWGSDKAHIFLSDGRYLRIDLNTRSVDAGYPKAIDNQTWPGMARYGRNIVAAVHWKSNKLYFIMDDGRYLRFDMTSLKLDRGYPKLINDSTWPGMARYAKSIVGLVYGGSGYGYFFLENGDVLTYDVDKNQLVQTRP